MAYYDSEEYKTLVKTTKRMLKQNYDLLKQGVLPKSYYCRNVELVYDETPVHINWRDLYCREFGFTLLSEDWIKPLATWIGDRPCLEIMAGTGYLTKFLSDYGVKIKATDNYSWNNYFRNFNNVEKLDAIQAIEKYGKDVKFIICSWPYMDDTAYRCLLKMREVNPSCRMIYIGEWEMGCTADEKFFEAVEECQVQGFYDAVKNYSKWYGLHDAVYLLK